MDTPYRAVEFARHDIILKPTMDQLQNNNRWIYENTPRGRFYRANGETKPTNLVLLAGKVRIPQDNKSDSATVGVQFAEAFAPVCNPSVTTGIIADFQRKIFCVVAGPGGSNYPNSNGFQVKVNIAAYNADNDVIKKDFWVHWSALGFRRVEINEF